MNNKNVCRLDGLGTRAPVARIVLAIAVLLAAVPSASAQDLLTNGNFETGDFSGWTVDSQAGSAGGYSISTPGAPTPLVSFTTAPNPTGGNFYAVSDTFGPGSYVLYQSFTVTAATKSLTLSYQMFANNQAGSTSTPPTLDYTTFPNQQVRVDILNSITDPFAVTTGVVRNFYDGADSGANPNPYTKYTFSLTGLAPGTYYLRFAEVDNQGVFNDGVDNVSLIAVGAFSAAGLTPNQQAVLGPINQGLNQGSNNAILGRLFNGLVSTGNVGAALDSFSPEKLQIFSNVAIDNFGFTARSLDNHLASLRYGRGGFDTSGLQVLDPSTPSTLSQIKSRLLAFDPAPASKNLMSDFPNPVMAGVKMSDPKDTACGCTPVSDTNRWSTFISGNVILADVGSGPDVSHARYTTGGVMAGSDYRIDDHWAVGGLLGYGHSSLTLDNMGSKGRVDSYSPGVYATYADKGWYANGLFAYTYNSYGENRVIPVLNDAAHGSTSGNQFGSNLDGGYEFHGGNWTFGPTAALQYVHLGIDSITESGGGALDIDNQDTDSLRTRFGGQVRYDWKWYGGKVTATPTLGVSWQHEYLDDSRGITSQFDGAGLGSFTVHTAEQDRDSAVITAGLDTQWNSAFSLFLDYQAQAGQSDFFAQSIEGGARVSF